MAARIAEQSKHSVVREPWRMGCWQGWRARLLDDRRDVVWDEGCLLGLRVIQETGVRHEGQQEALSRADLHLAGESVKSPLSLSVSQSRGTKEQEGTDEGPDRIT